MVSLPEFTSSTSITIHKKNAGTLGMVPLVINPMYTLHSGYFIDFIGYILNGLVGGLNS